MSKLRVLALCGYTQNAFIYSKQLGAIRKACKDVEFVFLDPPIVVEAADMPGNTRPEDLDSQATTQTDQQTAETTPRGWWLSNSDRSIYRRYDEMIPYVHKFMVDNGPFDGVMGFSQGACLAAILAALCEKPNLDPQWPSNPAIPKFKFVIAVGAFLPIPKTPSFEGYFPLPAHLPTLHVIGKNDPVITPERSQTLVEKCLNARVEYHDGRHYTPSTAAWRHFMNAYISSFAEGGSKGDVGPVRSFGPSGTSTPISGAGTPQRSSPAPAT